MQYPNIAQPQYGFGPTMPPGMYDTPPALMNFKKGGDVEERRTYGLENAAEMLRQRGRGDDTILAHINPQEAGILKLLGGSGTINPYTGLPEFGWFKKVTGISTPSFIKNAGDSVTKFLKDIGYKFEDIATDIGQGIERGVESVAKKLGPVGTAAAAYFGGPIGAALYQGLAAPGSSFDTKGAAKVAALTYGVQQLSQGMGGEGGYNVQDGGGGFDLGYGGEGLDTAALPVDQVGALGEYPSVIEAVSAPVSPSSAPIPGVGANAPAPTTMSGLGSLAGATGERVLQAITPTSALDALRTASALTTAYGTIKTKQELEDQKEEAERILAEKENKTKEQINWAESVLRDYPINYQRLTAEEVAAEQKGSTSPSVSTPTPTVSPAPSQAGYSRLTAEDILKEKEMAGGGLASLNAFKSGGAPRFLKGGGDGMSDDIPATIGGRQKAALSDGEFVIPADVVSHLGNGSSRAGAKKLYKMMDNIRKARTGKKRQAPEVSADRYMPA